MNTFAKDHPVSRLTRTMLFLGILLGSLGLLAGRAAAQEPVLGTWKWDDTKQDFTLLPDGTARQTGRTGKWVSLPADSGARSYRITWENGKFLDTLTIANYGTELVGQNQYNYKLHATRVGVPASSPSASQEPPPVVSEPLPASTSVSCVMRFSEQLPRAAEWTLAPLEIQVPATVRGTVVAMDAGLRDEAAHAPQASIQTYRQGVSLCQLLASTLNERQNLLQQNAQMNNGGGLTDAWKKSWNDRVFVVGPMVEKSYAEFREALRVSPRSAYAVMADRSTAFELPNLPNPPAPSQQAAAGKKGRRESSTSLDSPSLEKGNALPMGNGGLNRGAYDKHYIWTWRPWPYYWP